MIARDPAPDTPRAARRCAVRATPCPAPDESCPLPQAGEALWVFGYGSLIWNPGFAHELARPALLRGRHRRFCIWSHRYRGTPETPGLVLGLDRGGACRGMAFRVAAADAADALAYLDERELSGGVYRRRLLPVRLLDGGRETVRAVTYVARRDHPRYCLALSPEAAAAAIARGAGQRGSNREYLVNTVHGLRRLGLGDAGLDRIAALLPPA